MHSRIFALAATSLGYDIATGVGAQLAREDHRVWDLAEKYQVELDDAAHEALDGSDAA